MVKKRICPIGFIMGRFINFVSGYALPPGNKLQFVGQLTRVSERNLKARETGDITIASGAAASAAKPLVLV